MTVRRILSGLFGLALAVLLAGVLFYLSRFWIWRFWPNEGLFGLEFLRPDGDLLRRNLGEVLNPIGLAPLNALDVLLWGLLVFLALSGMQWLWNRTTGGDGH